MAELTRKLQAIVTNIYCGERKKTKEAYTRADVQIMGATYNLECNEDLKLTPAEDGTMGMVELEYQNASVVVTEYGKEKQTVGLLPVFLHGFIPKPK